MIETKIYLTRISFESQFNQFLARLLNRGDFPKACTARVYSRSQYMPMTCVTCGSRVECRTRGCHAEYASFFDDYHTSTGSSWENSDASVRYVARARAIFACRVRRESSSRKEDKNLRFLKTIKTIKTTDVSARIARRDRAARCVCCAFRRIVSLKDTRFRLSRKCTNIDTLWKIRLVSRLINESSWSMCWYACIILAGG